MEKALIRLRLCNLPGVNQEECEAETQQRKACTKWWNTRGRKLSIVSCAKGVSHADVLLWKEGSFSHITTPDAKYQRLVL